MDRSDTPQLQLDLVAQLAPLAHPLAQHLGAQRQRQTAGGCLAQRRGQLQRQALERAVQRNLGLTMTPAQRGVVTGAAAGVLGQQARQGHLLGFAQALGADLALQAQQHGRLTGVVGHRAHAAFNAHRPAQKPCLHALQGKAAFGKLQRALCLAEQGCGGHQAHIVACQLHAALHLAGGQVMQWKAEFQTGLQRACCLCLVQHAAQQAVQRGLLHRHQHQGRRAFAVQGHIHRGVVQQVSDLGLPPAQHGRCAAFAKAC